MAHPTDSLMSLRRREMERQYREAWRDLNDEYRARVWPELSDEEWCSMCAGMCEGADDCVTIPPIPRRRFPWRIVCDCLCFLMLAACVAAAGWFGVGPALLRLAKEMVTW